MRLVKILAAITAIFAATSAHAADFQIDGSGRYSCIHKDDYNQTAEFIAQNDREAFTKFLGLGINTGVCTMFKAGEPVNVSSAGFMTTQIRRQGDTTKYWTSTESLKSR